MEKTVPVILGSDINVFGVASSFYQEYGHNSIAIGKVTQFFTDNLDYLKVFHDPEIHNPDRFVELLNNIAENLRQKGMKGILFPCSDVYAELTIKNQDRIDSNILINTITEDLRERLENKKDFYETCEKYGLSYPDTFLISEDNHRDFQLPFDFPVIAKPSDSIKYVDIRHFDGYKKAYKVETMDELKNILKKVYEAGYDDYFVIQDFVPGGTDAMYVVNAYVSTDGKVRMTCGARCALDECLPNDIGNYNALITGDYHELTEMVKEFLEKIGYRGYANFDFKFDRRDGKYKVFEINLRQGRSSYYMTVAGNNFVKYAVDDMVLGNPAPYVDFKEEYLWYYTAKKILKKYCPVTMQPQVEKLLRDGKAMFPMDYNPSGNIMRKFYSARRKGSTAKYYPIYQRGREEE